MAIERLNMAEGSSTGGPEQTTPSTPEEVADYLSQLQTNAQTGNNSSPANIILNPGTEIVTSPQSEPVNDDDEPKATPLPQPTPEQLQQAAEMMKAAQPRNGEWPPSSEPQRQIEKLSEIMSGFESLGMQYEQLRYNPDFQGLEHVLQSLSAEARSYFVARRNIFDAWVLTPYVGGEMGAFTKLAEIAGSMIYADTMLNQDEVATAYMEFELRSKQSSAEDNPAKADLLRFDSIRREIALNLARQSKDQQLVAALDAATAAGDEPQKRLIIQMIEKKHIWAVRQAETLWRMWMRSALSNGIVFKKNIPEEKQQELRSLRPTELASHWQELQEAVDWNKSIVSSSTAEFTVTRVVQSQLFFEKIKRGQARMRPYMYLGSQDFVSNYLDVKFLTKASNFKDGIAFEVENEKDKDNGNVDRVLIKKDQAGNIIEKVLVRRNGVVEFDNEHHFDPRKVRWTSGGADAYNGVFAFYNLTTADALRKALLDPDKLARDPSLKALMDIYGGLDRFKDIQEDIDAGKDVAAERRNGIIYRQDIFMMYGLGLLDFSRHDLRKVYKSNNFRLDEIVETVDRMRSRNTLTDQLAKQMKEQLTGLDPIGQGIVLTYYRTNPAGVFMAMLQAFLKAAIPLK